ncbi:MAG: FAD:protein FMN transferase [Pseudomonadota bacterium]
MPTLPARRDLLLVCLAAVCASCSSDDTLVSVSGETMGTTYNVSIVDPPKNLSLSEIESAITRELSTANAIFSNWDTESEVSRFNRSAARTPVRLSDAFSQLLDIADFVHVASEGRFDLTAAPLIELWGFGESGPAARVPTDAQILSTLASVGQQRVINRASGGMALFMREEGASLNVAAIAKGAGIDAVSDRLQTMGLENVLVEIGGDLRARGAGPHGSGWRIGVEKPGFPPGAVQEVVVLQGAGMATSGDYRNYFEEDGVRYPHIIDPTTGRPVTHATTSVTVIADSATLADAWATALLVLGRERGAEIAEKNGIAALFLERTDEAAEFQRYASATFKAYARQDTRDPVTK